MTAADLVLPAPAGDFAQAAQRWARERYPLQVHRELAREADGAIAARLWSEIAQMGWTVVLVPEGHGGLAGDLVQACGLAHACGRSLLALPWLEHAVLAATVLAAAPEGAARDGALAAMAQGTVALAALEAGQRNLLQRPACRADEAAGGWRVQGRKVAVAGAAGRLLVTASTGSGEALLLDVDRRQPGVSMAEGRGLDGHRVADVTLDAVVPASGLLARGDAVAGILARAQDAAALAACAEACGLASMALESTLEHLATREQFGQPIGRFQALQHRAADMFVALRYAAAMAWGTIEAHAAGSADAAAVGACKAEVLRQCRGVLAGATQLHGGMGVVDEMPVSHALKRLVVLDARYGGRDWQLERVAAALAGPGAPTLPSPGGGG